MKNKIIKWLGGATGAEYLKLEMDLKRFEERNMELEGALIKLRNVLDSIRDLASVFTIGDR